MVACAIAFAGFEESANGVWPKDPGWLMSFRVSDFLVWLLALCTFFLVLRRWQQTKTFALHPGHFIALVLGFGFIAHLLAMRVFALPFDGTETYQELNALYSREEITAYLWQFYVAGLGVRLLTTIVAAAGILRYRWWWKLTFASLAILWLIQIHQNWVTLRPIVYQEQIQSGELEFSNLLESCATYALYSSVLLSIAIDVFGRIKRDKVHWLGLVIWFAVAWISTALTLIALEFVSVQELYGL